MIFPSSGHAWRSCAANALRCRQNETPGRSARTLIMARLAYRRTAVGGISRVQFTKNSRDRSTSAPRRSYAPGHDEALTIAAGTIRRRRRRFCNACAAVRADHRQHNGIPLPPAQSQERTYSALEFRGVSWGGFGSSTHSVRPSSAVWAWDCRSAVRSSKRMADVWATPNLPRGAVFQFTLPQ